MHIRFLIRCFVLCASEDFPTALFPQIYISQLSFHNEAADKGALSSNAKGKEKQCLIVCEVYLPGDWEIWSLQVMHLHPTCTDKVSQPTTR